MNEKKTQQNRLVYSYPLSLMVFFVVFYFLLFFGSSFAIIFDAYNGIYYDLLTYILLSFCLGIFFCLAIYCLRDIKLCYKKMIPDLDNKLLKLIGKNKTVTLEFDSINSIDINYWGVGYIAGIKIKTKNNNQYQISIKNVDPFEKLIKQFVPLEIRYLRFLISRSSP